MGATCSLSSLLKARIPTWIATQTTSVFHATLCAPRRCSGSGSSTAVCIPLLQFIATRSFLRGWHELEAPRTKFSSLDPSEDRDFQYLVTRLSVVEAMNPGGWLATPSRMRVRPKKPMVLRSYLIHRDSHSSKVALSRQARSTTTREQLTGNSRAPHLIFEPSNCMRYAILTPELHPNFPKNGTLIMDID